MEVYHYIFGFTIFLCCVTLSQSDKPSGLSQGTTHARLTIGYIRYYLVYTQSLDDKQSDC